MAEIRERLEGPSGCTFKGLSGGDWGMAWRRVRPKGRGRRIRTLIS